MSGIYIPGMEMPITCLHCWLNSYNQCRATGGDTIWAVETQNRRGDCPLVPVPEHGDLIDQDEYRDEFMNRVYELCADDPDNYRANAIIDCFDSAPTVIPADPAEEGET